MEKNDRTKKAPIRRTSARTGGRPFGLVQVLPAVDFTRDAAALSDPVPEGVLAGCRCLQLRADGLVVMATWTTDASGCCPMTSCSKANGVDKKTHSVDRKNRARFARVRRVPPERRRRRACPRPRRGSRIYGNSRSSQLRRTGPRMPRPRPRRGRPLAVAGSRSGSSSCGASLWPVP